MKKKSVNNISDEVLAAFLDGNATAQESQAILDMIEVDEPVEEDEGYVTLVNAEKDENGEDSLVTIDDDEEFDDVADLFDDMFSEEIDYDGN